METVCKLRYREGHARRARVRNLVAPLRYESESIPISDDFVAQVSQALENLRDKQGLTVRFIGYTDDTPLAGREARIYGNPLTLSKARALRVALAMQETLGLPTDAVASDGRGTANPLASNDTERGRALNRRIEVEFWYDDPLQELPDEPQLCPGDGGEEVVTRVYDPPWGDLAPVAIEEGQPIVPDGLAADLARGLKDVAERMNPRLRFVGYTRNERLDRRTAAVYGDDIGLSAARARRALESVTEDPLLSGAGSEHEGRGYVHSDDVVNAGFVQGEESFVRVEVVYDEPAPIDDYEGVDITPITRELEPKSPYELNVMRITVDGEPIDDPGRSYSDIQRCTDVALEDASIRFRFDNLDSRRRLGVAASPASIPVGERASEPATVRFRAYDNYSSFIERGEIRVLAPEQSRRSEPLAVIALDDDALAEWQPPAGLLSGPTRELAYFLRVYDAKGNFDETDARPLWLRREGAAEPATRDSGMERELLGSYGESDVARAEIPVRGGAVHVEGSGIPQGHTVWFAGRRIPVDAGGRFVAQQILPPGAHTVEVAVLDDEGNGQLYLRDLVLKRRDLFFMGLADLTLSESSESGPVELLQGEDVPQPFDSNLDGRLAFYLNGKLSEQWNLTASADTREGPVDEIFGNFLDKAPEALFRRIDPDYFYPTFGDDSVVEQMAPTLGKFYVKATRDDDHAMWGNFDVSYVQNELAHVDRGLYGANAHYESEATTGFGERKLTVDAFAAEPGTVPSYEEFRGTGGSIYYLRHQDVLEGSERVRIELRDKDSRIVTGVVNLRYGVDYDIDYLQGRILLSEPLSSTAADDMLVRIGGLSGDEVYLVARYEYTPGITELEDMAYGGQGHYWLGDRVRLGVTTNSNEEGEADSELHAADVTIRMSDESWIKLQAGRSEGLISTPQRSADGGYGFSGPDPGAFADRDAGAYRADLSVGLGDFLERDGRLTFYVQELDAGYSAPGQATVRDTEQYGGTFAMPVTDRLDLTFKGDRRIEKDGLENRALELNARLDVTERWSVSGGVRNDLREDRSPVVPLTQDQGERTDAVVQVGYDPGKKWRAYGFVQETVATKDDRQDNGRVGIGGSYRLTRLFSLDAEVSDGDLGVGGRVGTTFMHSERTSLYLNYALENERTDGGRRIRRSNLVSGIKRRLSDTSSVYYEERHQHRGELRGLTQAAGVQFAGEDGWNLSANSEFGTLIDSASGAETDRTAAGFRVGYGAARAQFSTGVEYRLDDAEQPDASFAERKVWLLRNNFKLQLTPDWRLLGKLNYSDSTSSLGDFFDGGYTEGVLGWAYRPVGHDRLSALAKYTYFHNVPTTDQLGAGGSSAEFVQKSHVASLDVDYDISRAWSLGGKYAYRLGEISLDREDEQFFDNRAQLLVLRADWRFLKNWEGLIEARSLELPDLDQRRRGSLVGLYRYVGKHFKVGAGYNFTDFSDDLTDLSYDHQGFFINLVGTM
jgi:flagellar motor protein MotB